MFVVRSRGYGPPMSQGFRTITTPFDTRIYMKPKGERCRLVVALVNGPWPEPRWSVELLNDQNVSPIDGVMAIVHAKDRDEARVFYRERLAALRAAGWRRV